MELKRFQHKKFLKLKLQFTIYKIYTIHIILLFIFQVCYVEYNHHDDNDDTTMMMGMMITIKMMKND